MAKYKIKDLLLIYEDKDYRFAVLNNNGDKIKIITKNQILPITDDLNVYVDINAPSDFFAYEVFGEITAEPIVVKGYKANIALSKNGEPKKYDDIEEFNQLSTILLANEMYHSANILSAIFGIDDDFEFENENRNKFIDEETIEKIEKAINVAESRNEYNIRKDEQLKKQRRKIQEDEKSYRNTLEF